VPVTGSNKIERLRPNLCLETAGLPACLIPGAGSSESSGMPLWEAFAGGVEALGVDPGEESEGHGERRSTCGRAGPVQPFGWDFQTLCFGSLALIFGRRPVGRSAYDMTAL
jgi:hypothetical protein